MKSLSELDSFEFKSLERNGHLGIRTREIAELRHFYDEIEEERKRRNLKLRELQKILPIGRYYTLSTNYGTYFFKVINCKKVNDNGIDHITHICDIDGFVIHDNQLIEFNSFCHDGWQITFEPSLLGWNANGQEMLFYKLNEIDLGSYEVCEISKEKFEEMRKTLENLGFEISNERDFS